MDQVAIREGVFSSDELFRVIFDDSFQFMAVSRTDGTLIRVNATAMNFIKGRESEILGRPFWQTPWWTHSPELQEKLRAAIHAAASGELVRFEATHQSTEGTVVCVDFSIQPVRNDKGDVILLLAVGRDISAYKRVEAELKNSEKLFRLLFEQSPLSIQIFSADGSTIMVSKSFETLWGVKFEELRNYNILRDKQLEELGLLPLIEKSFAGEVVVIPERQYDAQTTLGKGLTRWVSSVAYPVKDPKGKVRNVVLIHQDVTERKRAAAAMMEAKETAERSLKLKSRFLDVAAHELRTPVTAFSLMLELAQKQKKKGEPIEATLLERLQGQAKRLSRLVVDLLDVSRLERGTVSISKTSCDIVSLIQAAIEEVSLQSPGRHFELSKPNTAVLVELDPVRITQVLSNLLDNAAKYTPLESTIEVLLEVIPDRVRVSVHDHGAGISEEQQLTLFKPFMRGASDQEERIGGLGLGLYVCARLIHLHGGSIGVHSQPGVGSTFYFDLPRSEPHVRSTQEDDPCR